MAISLETAEDVPSYLPEVIINEDVCVENVVVLYGLNVETNYVYVRMDCVGHIWLERPFIEVYYINP